MIFFSDMDGTFLTSDKRVSEASWQALDAIHDAGIHFVPCTGRALSGIPAPILEHPAVSFAISANGASVSALDTQAPARTELATTIASWPLDRGRALGICAIARRHDVTIDVFADGRCLAQRAFFERLGEFVDDPGILRAMRATRTVLDETAEEVIERAGTLERLAFYWKDPADRDAILSELADMADIEVTRSYPMNIEVMGAGATKGGALAWLCRHLDTDPLDAVAFGDNMNDIPMLRRAGTGVAMANAEPEVIDAADIVATSNDDDGVARLIMELLVR
ncbi:MAG: Cof-type HAD-IIB family hydrolase [Collinsella sp.]|nr:Cof-type HAD-IIB family hydrolase [Collinsella sp.]